jgi:hypothetical protein
MKIATETVLRYRQVIGKIWDQAISCDFQGSDPYDGLKSRRLQPLLRRSRGLRLAVIQAVKRSPWNLRTLLDVPAGRNPKGLALFLAGSARLNGVLTLSEQAERQAWLADALVCLASHPDGSAVWPERRITSGAAARLTDDTEPMGWGYDFPWQSRAFLQQPFAPTVVATSFVVDALAAASSPAYAPVATAAATFVQDSLHHRKTEAGICISYSPRDNTCVYNASLFGAKILAHAANVDSNRSRNWMDLARQAAGYVLARQRPDGSWYYGESAHWHWIDNLHTGFVLQTLDYLSKACAEPAWREQIERGLAYYRHHLLRPDGTACYHPDRPFPLDAHTFAQAALTCLALREYDPALSDLARRIIDRAITALWDDKHRGFRFQQHVHHRINTIHLRWSQAWMFRAIAEFLASLAPNAAESSL